MIWGGIIAAAQVADSLKDVFPFTARHKAATELLSSLEVLVIDTLFEAEEIRAGRYEPMDVAERRRVLMKTHHDIETKHFPGGQLPERKNLRTLADAAAEYGIPRTAAASCS